MSASYGIVRGEFYTQQQINGTAVPLTGRITFTPRANARTVGRLYGATERIGHVVNGILCEDEEGHRPGLRLLAPSPGVEPSAWSWRVTAHLRDEEWSSVRWQPFEIAVAAGQEVDLVNSAPAAVENGVAVTRGDRGVGVADIALNTGQLAFQLDDGREIRVPLPAAEHPAPDPTIMQRLNALEARPNTSAEGITITAVGDGTATIAAPSNATTQITDHGDGTATIS